MEREQHLEQIDRRLDQLRHDAEAVHQGELLGLTLRQGIAEQCLECGKQYRTSEPGRIRILLDCLTLDE